MTHVIMLNDLRERCKSFAARDLHKKLDVLTEGAWLLLIFLLPVYFNPLCYNAFYFVKALALVFLVSLLLGLVLAQWFLAPHTVKVGELPAKIQKSPLQFASVVLGIIWVVSTIFSVMPGKSLWGNLAASTGFIPNLAWIIFFLIVSQRVKDRSQVFRALYTLLISSGVVSLVGILQFIRPDILPGFQYYGRVFSTDGSPLSLSGFLAMTLPVTLALIILNWYGWGSQPRSKLKFAALLVLFGLQLCCLAFAQYSITLLLFIIGIFVFFALIGIFLQRKTTLALSILAILLVAVIAFVLLGQMLLTEKTDLSVEKQSTNELIAEQAGLPTLTIRMQNWKCAADVIIDSPEIPFNKDSLHFLRRFIGYGPETFIATSQLKFPGSLKSGYTFKLQLISQPENHYLYLGVTLGILGLLAFLGLLSVFFYRGFRLLSLSNNKEIIVLTAAFVASIAQYCAHIFFNPSVMAPELVFWLVLGLTVALAKVDSTGNLGCRAGASTTGCATGATPGAGKLRKLMSVLIIIIFVAVGCGLTLPLLIANMKVQRGFILWDKDQSLALTSFSEATRIGPDQANYHDILGNIAFSMAGEAKTDPDMKSTLLTLGEYASNAAIQLEPQLAIYRYRLADREMYWIMTGSEEKNANILYLYQEADQLFPGNAVILNKWALALILMRDYKEAGQKLLESEKSDPSWVQTSYLKGLLNMYEGNIDEAGDLFVSPIKNELDNIGYFINFCGQVAHYGEIGLVKDALGEYVKNKNDDWTGFALLGIADIYSGNPAEALADFEKASMVVPDKDAALLAAIIETLLGQYQNFHNESGEIIKGLMEKAATAR
ncbi:MAG: tetratricopeptide repeat protein [Chloroflexi bacterium]|nr:tetratricopeptide repeat protein [Chloroflexota bacterium]